jgi:hypothetical protein
MDRSLKSEIKFDSAAFGDAAVTGENNSGGAVGVVQIGCSTDQAGHGAMK